MLFFCVSSARAYEFTNSEINSNPVCTEIKKTDKEFIKEFAENTCIKKQTTAGAGEPIYLVFRNAVLAGDFLRGQKAPACMNYLMIAKDGYIKEAIYNKVTGLTGTRIPAKGFFELNGYLFYGFVPEKFLQNGVERGGCFNLQINLEKRSPSEPNTPIPPTTEPNAPCTKEKIIEKEYREYKETVVQQTIMVGSCVANVGTIHHIAPTYTPGLVLTSVFGGLFWFNPIDCKTTGNPDNDPNGCGQIPPGLQEDDGGPPDINDIPGGIINTPEDVGTISDPIPVNPGGTTPVNPVIQPTGPVDIPSGILKSRVSSPGQK